MASIEQFPYVSEELIKELEERFPNRLPVKLISDPRSIAEENFNIGVQHVIGLLKMAHEDQKNGAGISTYVHFPTRS